MKSFISFLAIPAVVGGALTLSPWLTGMIVPPSEPINIQQLTLPPGARDLNAQGGTGARETLRLNALMPAFMIDGITPPPPSPVQRSAADRYRLASVLLSEEKSSVVINGRVLFEGNRLDEFRVRKIGRDRVILKGPKGNEIVHLDNLADTALFRVTKAEQNKLSFAMRPLRPAHGAPAQPALPAEELERQFRHLLENFSH